MRETKQRDRGPVGQVPNMRAAIFGVKEKSLAHVRQAIFT
jgi:hypothetical protein